MLSQLLLHPLDHTVDHSRCRKDSTGAHRIHRIRGNHLLGRGYGDIRQQAGSGGQCLETEFNLTVEDEALGSIKTVGDIVDYIAEKG